jgi:hypothetical protein
MKWSGNGRGTELRKKIKYTWNISFENGWELHLENVETYESILLK